MISSSSPFYTHSIESAQASFPRYPDSLAPGISPDALKVAYRRYKATRHPPPNLTKFNLVFLHGTGMNKGVWHYHIDRLYEKCWDLGIHIDVVLAMDTINHGTSAQVNNGKLGKVLDWRDVAYDVAKIGEVEKLCLLSGNYKNVLVGHSMAGLVSLFLAFIRPALFNACVVLNPVCYLPNDSLASPYEPFMTWRRKKYMETNFHFESPKNWKQKVIEYMLNKSFYREFDKRVLENMLEDEYPETEPQDNGLSITVKLNTTQEQTLITYFGAKEATKRVPPTFSGIVVPVYRILGELDISWEAARQKLQEAIPGMKTYLLPGEKHLLHGVHPDLFVNTLFEILKERKFAPATKFPYLDPDLRLKM